MITIKQLDQCSLSEALQVWNGGFSDYYVPIQMSMEMFIYRFAYEELSPKLSFVAYVDDHPAGIVLNGIRLIHGKKIAWNGGTSILPEYRRRGVGKALIDASLQIYREQGVEVATLEAFKQNERAISLYEQKGYQVVDILSHLELTDACYPFKHPDGEAYQVKKGVAFDLASLQLNNTILPWQTQWASLRRDGESLIIMDNGKTIGSILYKRFFDESGKLNGIGLYHFEVKSGRQDAEEIIHFGLKHVFASEHPVRHFAFNLPNSNQIVTRKLKEAGFALKHEQVFMIKRL